MRLFDRFWLYLNDVNFLNPALKPKLDNPFTRELISKELITVDDARWLNEVQVTNLIENYKNNIILQLLEKGTLSSLLRTCDLGNDGRILLEQEPEIGQILLEQTKVFFHIDSTLIKNLASTLLRRQFFNNKRTFASFVHMSDEGRYLQEVYALNIQSTNVQQLLINKTPGFTFDKATSLSSEQIEILDDRKIYKLLTNNIATIDDVLSLTKEKIQIINTRSIYNLLEQKHIPFSQVASLQPRGLKILSQFIDYDVPWDILGIDLQHLDKITDTKVNDLINFELPLAEKIFIALLDKIGYRNDIHVNEQKLTYEKRLEKVKIGGSINDIPDGYFCIISNGIMNIPVYDPDSPQYCIDAVNICAWLARCANEEISPTHPMTRKHLTIKKLTLNKNLQQEIENYVKTYEDKYFSVQILQQWHLYREAKRGIALEKTAIRLLKDSTPNPALQQKNHF